MSGNGGNFANLTALLFKTKSVPEIINYVLEGKSVKELLDLLKEDGSEMLLSGIISKIEEMVKSGGVVLSDSEKKILLKSALVHNGHSAQVDSIYTILSDGKGDANSEPTMKRRKIDKAGPSTSSSSTSSLSAFNNASSGRKNVNEESDIIDLCDSDPEVEDCTPQHHINRENNQEIVQVGHGQVDGDGSVSSDEGEEVILKIHDKSRRVNDFFKYTQLIINFNLMKPRNATGDWIEKGFEALIQEIRKESKSDEDRVTLKIFLAEEPTESGLYIGKRLITALTPDIIMDVMEKVHQSTEMFHTTDILQVKAFLFHPTEGSGRHHNPEGMTVANIQQYKNKSTVNINCRDNCLPIALLVGECLLNNSAEAGRKILRYQTYNNARVQDANRFVLSLGMKISRDGKYNLELIHKFVQKKDFLYRVNVYNKSNDFKSIIFSTKKTPENFNKVINIFYSEAEQHYICIKNLKGFFNYKHHCNFCGHLYNNTHVCPEKCKYCRNSPPCPSTPRMIDCLHCNRRFLGETCLELHTDNGTCNEIKMCKDCDIVYSTCDSHRCFTKMCDICYKRVENPHYCFIQPFKKNAPKEFSLIFYDLECELVDQGNGFSDHIPNLCVAHEVCHLCAKSAETDTECPNCSPSVQIFENDNSGSCIKKFTDYALKFRPFPSAVIAHNAKSYDGQFVLEELCKRDEEITPIFTGCKILYVKIRDIAFLDSLSFIPFALSKFSASFGLNDCEKGEYPYKFNTSANKNYIGEFPAREMFAVESMSSNRYEKFLTWYEANKHKTFDNRKELIYYCNQDVKILKLGCLNFMYSFLDTTGINPFLQAITLADAVMKVYRKNYLKPDTLAITPKSNYNSSYINLQSKIGLKWLVYQKMTTGKDIRYEVKLRNSHYIVDGFDDSTNTVYSFEGCYYHGHTCFLNRDYVCSEIASDTIQRRYEATLARLQRIENMGYNLVSVWECDFRRFLKSDPALEESLNNHPEIVDAGFDLRSAVYGGRTEVFKLYQKCGPGDKIFYYDFTSLYPWANKYSKYFVGHPTIVKTFENAEEILNYDGVAKCTVLPPRNLHLPCLPYRCNNRLVFPLCRSCTEMINTDRCSHNDDERSLTGFWSLDELRLSARHGYKIVKSFEVWSYQTVQYNRDTDERGLFADFVDNFLKIKQESSGWPGDADTDEAKEKYIRQYLEKEGIQLDKEKICLNKGLRLLTKLVLNSLWGRFIMRENFTKTSICNSPEELNRLIGSEDIQLMDLYPIGEKQIFVSWKYIAEAETASKYVNLGVGICTTTNARIKLYTVLSKLGKNVLYCDTDSVIFMVPSGEENPLSCGKFLGELTDELTDYGEGSFIEEYVSCGPKTYALKIYSPSTNSYSYKIVAKGISMNHEVERHLDFDALKSIVFGDVESLSIQYKDRIFRQKRLKIHSGPAHKKVQFTLSKRRCVEDFQTEPFGY